jgi:hypothetical protein
MRIVYIRRVYGIYAKARHGPHANVCVIDNRSKTSFTGQKTDAPMNIPWLKKALPVRGRLKKELPQTYHRDVSSM